MEGVVCDCSVAIVAGGVRGDLHKPCHASGDRSMKRPEIRKSWPTANILSAGRLARSRAKGGRCDGPVWRGARREGEGLFCNESKINIKIVLKSRTRKDADRL